jgi:predicted  nucleic acid-binding Zn-ribbon protein
MKCVKNFIENVNFQIFFSILLLFSADLYEYNQHVKKRVDQNFLETNRDDIERRHLSNEFNSLNDNRLLLRQKLALIQEHYKQLEMNVQREMKRQKDMEDKYDHRINHLRLSIQEYVSEMIYFNIILTSFILGKSS